MATWASIYLPLVASVFSLGTAMVVALIGYRSSRSLEVGRVRASYINYKIQKIMDEYVKYDPVIDLTRDEGSGPVKLIESRFRDCRSSILRIRPFLPQKKLERLTQIDNNYNNIIKKQYSQNLTRSKIDEVDANEYGNMLTEYINLGHKILEDEVKFLVLRLEAGGL